MSTEFDDPILLIALFGQTKRRLLILLYGSPNEAYYLRQLVRAGGLSLGAVQREVKRLTAAGILRRTVRGNQVYYQADRDCPIFVELQGLVAKTAGAAAGKAEVAFVEPIESRRVSESWIVAEHPELL